MKVAVIPTIREFSYGAPGHCMGVLVEKLLQAGHEVLWVVAPIDWENPEVVRLRKAGARTEPLPAAEPGFVGLRKLRLFIHQTIRKTEKLGLILRKFDPEHIYLNQGGTWCGIHPPFREVLQKMPGRYSLLAHSNWPRPAFSPREREQAQKLASGAKVFFFNSRWTRRMAEIQIAQEIPNGRVFQLPLRQSSFELLPWPQTRVPRLAMVSRHDVHTKGIDVALEAVAQLRKENLPVQLSLYGSGPEEKYVRELAGFFGAQDCVKFRGHVDSPRDIWQEEEMLLFPSRFEGFGAAMLEAMGFGRPVLRTPYGGAEEWMEDGRNGYVCPAPEVSLLVETLKRALAERERWTEMGRRAHEKVKANLDPDPGRVFLEALH